ncbi:membrane protein ORF82 [Cyprinid herpesvirus 1]|uniref:Membrane protein ORF82 n=1 Tax=Cyprinid herpesvirus 1 TaxID=317858 RepID=K7PBD3_9VIRU|nr:membrane protein ORF82 [Cyprinid herpesvirus 1]AFJ20379.1 membrane protein ORF82 [Cyprinid herpesvirus 1]
MSVYRFNRLKTDDDEGEQVAEGLDVGDGDEAVRGGGVGGTVTADDRDYPPQLRSGGRLRHIEGPGLDVACSSLFLAGWICMAVAVFMVDRVSEAQYTQLEPSASVYHTVLSLLGETANGTKATCFDGGITPMRNKVLTVSLFNVGTYLLKITVFVHFVFSALRDYAAVHTGGILLSSTAGLGLMEDAEEYNQRARSVALTMVRIALFPMAMAHLCAAIVLHQMQSYMEAYSVSVESGKRSYCFRVYLFYGLVFCQALLSAFAGLVALVKTVSRTDLKSTRGQIKRRLEGQSVTRIL